MSVEVAYGGRFGNNLFQYVCARLFAMDNGLRLQTVLPENRMVKASPHEGGEERLEPRIVLGDCDPLFSRRFAPAKYELRGFFQNGNWYFGREGVIKSFLSPGTLQDRNRTGIVAHCRLTDYVRGNWAIHPSWYLSILKKESFDQLYIVVDDFDEAYLRHFREYRPLVLCTTPDQDWNFLRSFDRMIISMSTFAWWAAFFSQASRIYTFKRYQFGMDLDRFPNGISVDGALLHEVS